MGKGKRVCGGVVNGEGVRCGLKGSAPDSASWGRGFDPGFWWFFWGGVRVRVFGDFD
jgi:hypothetical protein